MPIYKPTESGPRRLSICRGRRHRVVFEYGSRPGLAVALLLRKLGAHFLHLGAHNRVLAARRGEVFLERVDVFNGPAERFPLARLVVLGLRQAHAERLEAILHFTAAFALRKLMRHAQLGCPAVWRVAAARFRFSNQIANLFMLQRVVVYIRG